MSVINQVLKDLEERHATPTDAARLHAAVRPLPRPRRRSRWVLLTALLVMAGLGSGGWWFGLRQEATAARPAPAAATPLAAASPAAAAPRPALPDSTLAGLPAPQAAPLDSPPAGLPARQAGHLDSPPGGMPAPRAVSGDSPPIVSPPPPPAIAAEPLPLPPAPSEAAPAKPKDTLARPAKPRRPAPASEQPAPPAASTAAVEPAPAAAPDEVPDAPLVVIDEPGAIDKQMRWGSTKERAEADYRRGVHLYEDGRASEAEGAWREALETDPPNLAARHALLGVLLERGEREQAMRVVQDGLIADPGQHRLRMILARMQLDTGAQAEALRTLEAGLSDPAVGADYLTTTAAIMVRAGRNREAAQLYQRALGLAPGNPVWYMGLGMALRADGRDAEALAAFERARAAKSLAPELQAFVDGQVRELR